MRMVSAVTARRAAFCALGAILILPCAARAGELAALQGGTLQLGSDWGSVYYTVEPDGLRVVATVSEAPQISPVRFVATLRPGQSLTLSVAHAAGTQPSEVLIRRVGDRIVLDGGNDVVPTD